RWELERVARNGRRLVGGGDRRWAARACVADARMESDELRSLAQVVGIGQAGRHGDKVRVADVSAIGIGESPGFVEQMRDDQLAAAESPQVESLQHAKNLQHCDAARRWRWRAANAKAAIAAAY